MTDPDTANRTYIGPMTPELVESIIAKARAACSAPLDPLLTTSRPADTQSHPPQAGEARRATPYHGRSDGPELGGDTGGGVNARAARPQGVLFTAHCSPFPSATDWRAGASRRGTDRRQAERHPNGGGPPAFQGSHGPPGSEDAPVRHRVHVRRMSAACHSNPLSDAATCCVPSSLQARARHCSVRAHRLVPAHHPPRIHAGRLRRRHRVQQAGVRGHCGERHPGVRREPGPH